MSADAQDLRRVFLVARLEEVASLLSAQGETTLRDAGVEFPARTAPLMLLLKKAGSMSAADLAKAVQQPHQLVSQRVEALLACKAISRTTDKTDARRKVLKITPKGERQLELLKHRLDLIEVAYAALFDEIGCDVSEVVLKLIDALRHTPLHVRIQSLES